VLHDFYVPQFRAKMDLVPGMVSYFWFTPEKAGTVEILCAEFCGVGHSMMRGYVVVEAGEAHQAWLREQQTFAQSLAAAADRSRELTLAD
jgi:cytochrome c oxidase subunit 2